MIATGATIISKYAIPALFGAATKTYIDFKKEEVSIGKLIGNLLLNSFFALGFGSMVAHAFVESYPSKESLAYVAAYLAGAIGINLLAGLLAINWERIISKRLGGGK